MRKKGKVWMKYMIIITNSRYNLFNTNDYLEVLNISKYYSNVINFSDFVILKTMQDKKNNKMLLL